jgi:spore maturation protein CgeB
MKITIIGLSITSSWGNGHATTYRSLVKGLKQRGHNVVFLERNVPWYASNRDMPEADFCKVILYDSVTELKDGLSDYIEEADVVITGSYVPEGILVGGLVQERASGIRAFYDIDTPVTLASMRKGTCEYLAPNLIPGYDLYLSFTAGRCLDIFEHEFGSPAARPLYCSVDPDLYYPVEEEKQWDLGYLGTYSEDRQFALNKLFIDTAHKWKKGKFVVAGPQFPKTIIWPENVERIEHLPPDSHVKFYNSQRYTLNVTRKDMVRMGYSPSVRLFEAAACGVPIISDYWEGIDSIFTPGKEILISASADDTLNYLRKLSDKERHRLGENARKIILEKHTGNKRAAELEQLIVERQNDNRKVIEGIRV